MYKEFLDDICKKYNYDNNLRKAIKIVFSLMMEEYNDLEGIKNIFSTVRIFSVPKMDKGTLNGIESIMMENINQNILFEETNAYGNNNAGAFYQYFPIFDTNMNLIGESRWIVAKDMGNELNGNGYMNLFGTTINIPYFLHELNHAYAMSNPIYKIEDDKIYSKHGMFETIDKIENLNDKIKVSSSKQDYIMVEEIINEWITHKMLCSFFKVDDFIHVYKMLQSINHVPAVYTRNMINLAQYFEFAVGKDNLMRYRKDNDYSVIKKFNLIACESELCNHYFESEEPYAYFGETIFKMYKLRGHKLEYYGKDDKMKIYEHNMLRLYYDALAPIYSYNFINNNKGIIESYLNSRCDDLGETTKNYSIKK